MATKFTAKITRTAVTAESAAGAIKVNVKAKKARKTNNCATHPKYHEKKMVTKSTAVTTKSAAGATKLATSATLPKYHMMIEEAITSLKERNGSSQYAIAKFMEEHHSLPSNFKKQLLVQLKSLVASKKLIKVKRSYKIPSKAPAKKKAKKQVKKAKVAPVKTIVPKAMKKATPVERSAPEAVKMATPVKKATAVKKATPAMMKATMLTFFTLTTCMYFCLRSSL